MVAWPFAKSMKGRAFLERLKSDYGVTIEHDDEVSVPYMQRIEDGETHQHPIVFEMDENLPPRIMMNACERLRIPLEDFDLKLGAADGDEAE